MTAAVASMPLLDTRAAAEARRRKLLERGDERLARIATRPRTDERAAPDALAQPRLEACNAEGRQGSGGGGSSGGDAAGAAAPQPVLHAAASGGGGATSAPPSPRYSASLPPRPPKPAGGVEGVAKEGGGSAEDAQRVASQEAPPSQPAFATATPTARPPLQARPVTPPQPPPEQRRLEHVQRVLGATRRGRLAAALGLGLAVAASHARPHLLPQGLPVAPPPLLLFLTGELATLLAAALLLPRGAAEAQRRPRHREGGDTGWLSVLGVAATLIPAARRPLTMLRAALGVAVALADDAALFILTLLLARAAAAVPTAAP